MDKDEFLAPGGEIIDFPLIDDEDLRMIKHMSLKKLPLYFLQNAKNLIFDPFLAKTDIFSRYQALSLFIPYGAPTSYQRNSFQIMFKNVDFGPFGHAWASLGMPTGKVAPSVYSPYGITSSYKKSSQTVKRFLRYSNLKNQAI